MHIGNGLVNVLGSKEARYNTLIKCLNVGETYLRMMHDFRKTRYPADELTYGHG